ISAVSLAPEAGGPSGNTVSTAWAVPPAWYARRSRLFLRSSLPASFDGDNSCEEAVRLQ
ncbi:hypothetical protein AVEN_148116-1, partial [Araneus ventricosus]